MECLCITYKKLFYKQAEMLCVSFWTTSLMHSPRATGTRKQYCIEEEQDKVTLSAAGPGKPRTSKKKQSSEEDLRNLCVRCLEEPQGSTGKQGPKNQENYTPTEIQEVTEDLCFPFSLTWMSHWDYKGRNQFASRSPSSYFPLPSEQSVKASVVVIPGEKGKETACMMLIILNRVSWENDLLVVFSYLEIYLILKQGAER